MMNIYIHFKRELMMVHEFLHNYVSYKISVILNTQPSLYMLCYTIKRVEVPVVFGH